MDLAPGQIITAGDIQRRLMNDYGIRMSQADIRSRIHTIRTRGLGVPLIATNKGYKLSYDPDELRRYINSLQRRIEAIERVRKSIEKQLNVIL